MDNAIEFDEELRLGAPESMTSTPLRTHIWRQLRDEHKLRTKEFQALTGTIDHLRAQLGCIALHADALRSIVHSHEESPRLKPIHSGIEQILEALEEAGISIVSPAGQEYSEKMVELFENIAQQVDPDAQLPHIVDVVEPAILCDGQLLQMGKVIVGIPQNDADES